MRACRLIAVVAMFALSAVWATAQALEPASSFVMDLNMRGALVQPKNPGDGRTLLLQVRRDGNYWERAWGLAGDFNRSVHHGWVTDATVTDAAITLAVRMTIVGDPYVPGGRAVYSVSLKKSGDGQYAGSYTGEFNGTKLQGDVTARVWPAMVATRDPFKPGEHPRILFRKADIPALKAKAETAFGKAALAKMDDGIGMGIKYQLTGDAKHAQAAATWIEDRMTGKVGLPSMDSHHQSLQKGWFFEEVGMTYDLCADAWTEAFKLSVRNWIVLWSYRQTYQKSMFNTQIAWDNGGAEAGNLYHGTAFAGLAIAGEKGNLPMKPVEPFLGDAIAPAAGHTPGKGVPVVKHGPKTPAQWLYSTPADSFGEGDVLADLGGTLQARPQEGDAFTFDGIKCAFAPLPAEHLLPQGGIIVNLGKAMQPDHVKTGPGPQMKADGPMLSVFYTVVDNEQPRTVKVHAPWSEWGKTQVVLGGKQVIHGQVIKLEKGLYPLLFVLRLSARWHNIDVALPEATEADIAAAPAFTAAAKAEYLAQVKDHEFAMADCARNGGANADYQRVFEMGRYQMFIQNREGMGDGGMHTEFAGAGAKAAWGPARYAFGHRVAVGRDVSPYPDVTHMIARKVFANVYPEKGPSVTQDIHGHQNPSASEFAFNYTISPDAWKPALLWAWNRECGITGPEDAAKSLGGGHPCEPIWAFLSYPLDGKSLPPKGILPLTWAASTFGYYGFRNAHENADDFLAQVWARAYGTHGYALPNAGAIRLMGLGHTWAHAQPPLRLHNQRSFDSVVQLPEDDIYDNAQGRVTHAAALPDGSGTVTIDLSDIYAGAKKNAKGGEMSAYDRYGGGRQPERLGNNGITGLRAVAVDYSGKSGSPCLMAVVDKITGGKKKVWTWYLKSAPVDVKTGKPTGPSDLSDPKNVTVDATGCTIRKADGASIRFTVVGPLNPQVKADVRSIIFSKTYNRGEGTYMAPGVFITGPKGDEGDFFIIATVQKGDAPAVKVEGQGLAAKVTVGGRIVRFDKDRLVLE